MGRHGHLGIKDPKTVYSVGALPERQRPDKKVHARSTGKAKYGKLPELGEDVVPDADVEAEAEAQADAGSGDASSSADDSD